MMMAIMMMMIVIKIMMISIDNIYDCDDDENK